MKQLEIENQLREAVSKIMLEVEAATKQSRYDINLALEDAWIPILSEAYQLPNLYNLNKKKKNFPGIDLGCERDRVAFQVSSTTSLEKVKSTLNTFIEKNYQNTFDEVFVFTLVRKNKSYSQESVDAIVGDKINFSTKKHIIDPLDVLEKISGLRLVAQQRCLDELRVILGQIEIHSACNIERKEGHTLVSNLLELDTPEKVYVAELNINKEEVLQEARLNFNFRKKKANKQLLVKLALLISGFEVDDWAIYENKIFTFRNLEKDSELDSIIDKGTVEYFETDELSNHELSEYTNLMRVLLKNSLRESLKIRNVDWHRKEKLFYFKPLKFEDDSRKEEWIGKKKSVRTVFEKKMQTKDPTKIAHYKHFSFQVRFVLIANKWYCTIVTSWFYSYDHNRKSIFHDKLLTAQKRHEYNQSVRNMIRFLAFFLSNQECAEESLNFGSLLEIGCDDQEVSGGELEDEEIIREESQV